MKAEHDHRTLVRGRTATSLLFLLFGTALGTWTSRIPAVKGHLGLSDGLLSLALLAFAVGSIVGMLLLGRLADRFGSTLVMVPTALLEGVLLVPPAYVGSLVGLATALFLFGLTHGTLNIAMNANAVHVQEAYGRPIMSSFHAVYSIGGFLGAAVGGVLARQDVGPGATFITVGTGVLVLAGWAGLWALPETRPERVPRPAGPPKRVARTRSSPSTWSSSACSPCARWSEKAPRPTGARCTCTRASAARRVPRPPRSPPSPWR
ncbi:hypothetical protein BC342_02705 [Streptomyces olivaceus]|nr:hypothetical protein BC342_02705 [Streptomyces olivaceus]